MTSIPAIYLERFKALLQVERLPLFNQLPAYLQKDFEPDEIVHFNGEELQHLLSLFSEVESSINIGFEISERLPISVFGFLGMVAINGATIHNVLTLIQQFLIVKTNLFKIELLQGSDALVIKLVLSPEIINGRKTILEASINTLYGIFDFVTMGRLQCEYIALPYERCYKSQDLSQFRCPVHFSESYAGFSISLEAAHGPLKMANALSQQEAIRLCQIELQKLPQQQDFSAKVQSIVIQYVNRMLSLNEVASRLNLTERTLHRRLKEEGQSFKKINEHVKHQMALRYLQSNKLAIQEVAYALGYTDPANFRRAFKRWQKQSPSQYLESIL